MSKRRAGLGKGLDALLPESLVDGEAPAHEPPADVAVNLLHSGGHQPRRRVRAEGIAELAQSIRTQGLLEPIIVRHRAAGGYEIIAGERRWRAARQAGLTTVPVIVRDVDDRQALAIALIENIQREDLSPLEEALALRRLVDEYDLTHEELADTVGRSRTAVTNLLRLLNLSPKVRELLDEGALEMGHARALLALGVGDQEGAAQRVIARGLSVRQTEALVKRLLSGEQGTALASDPDTQRLERTLSETLGAPTSITASKGGKGRIVIRYASLDELDGILARIVPSR